VSLFEPETEIIRKGKAGKPTEFGKMALVPPSSPEPANLTVDAISQVPKAPRVSS
jgi:hypothetical protein